MLRKFRTIHLKENSLLMGGQFDVHFPPVFVFNKIKPVFNFIVAQASGFSSVPAFLIVSICEKEFSDLVHLVQMHFASLLFKIPKFPLSKQVRYPQTPCL
jgi:hypothetical protein